MTDTTKTTVTEEQFELLGQIHDTAANLLHLTNDIKVQANRLEDSIRGGFHPAGMSHQTPHDVTAAVAKLECLVRQAQRAFKDERQRSWVSDALCYAEERSWLYSHFTLAS